MNELLARAEDSHRYAVHLIADAAASTDHASRPRALGTMACEHLLIAARVLFRLHTQTVA